MSVANLQDGDEAEIKTVTMNLEGSLAYGYLKADNGVHRMLRVSPYNAQGKRMTSFASVFVTPLVDDSIEAETVVVQPTEIQKRMVESLSERAGKVHGGSVDPRVDNMLKLSLIHI